MEGLTALHALYVSQENQKTMKTMIRNLLASAVILCATITSYAKESKLYDGSCRNVTHQLDGYLKLFTIQDGQDIKGFISISGWLTGSGEISGKRDGNSIKFTSVDATGLKIRWEGLVRDKVLDGEYFIDAMPDRGMDKQSGEFKVSLVDIQDDGVAENEESFRKLFMLGLEADLNAPVKLQDGTVAFGADALFQSIHPVGQGVGIRVTGVDIDWKEGASRKDAKEIRKYTINYTLYWHGVLTRTGWTKMSMSYNANLGEVTDHRVVETTGTTNAQVNDVAFGIGVLLGQAAVEAMLNSD